MSSNRHSLLWSLPIAAALCRPAPAAPSPSADAPSAALERLKKDPELYVGEGQADFKGAERGEAREKARDRALADLSKKISTHIEVIIRDEAGFRSDDRKYSEYEAFQRILNSRTDQAVADYQDQDYLNYPEDGMYTVVVFVNKQKVNEEARADLARKKEKVTEFLQHAASARESGNTASALRDYLSARELAGQFFEGMPVTASLGGRDVELGAFADSSLEGLLGAITLTPLKAAVQYTAQGNPRGVVAVGVDLKTARGVEPVAKLPLAVAFTKGSGRLASGDVVTDSSGTAELPLDWVDPSSASAALAVSLGGDLAGRLPAQGAKPSCVIGLSRAKSIAYALDSRIDGAAAVPEGFDRRVRESLREAGFEGVKIAPAADGKAEDALRRARAAHADFLLVLNLTARTRHEADLDLFSAQTESSAELRALADRSEVFSVAGPSGKGFGASAAGAGWDALGKIEKGLLLRVKERIQGVR